MPPTTSIPIDRLLKVFLSNKSVHTITAYNGDLGTFRQFRRAPTIGHAASELLLAEQGAANAMSAEFRAWLESLEKSPATINRKLAVLRALCDQARTLGMIDWQLSIKGPKSEPYRDTRGPGERAVQEIARIMRGRRDKKGIRDYAIFRLLFDLALRRGEITALDLSDVEVEGSRLWIRGKGKAEKRPLTLPEKTAKALAEWILVRNMGQGPLFVNLDNAHEGERLSTTGLYKLVKRLGAEIGIDLRPHGIRHTAITAAVNHFPLPEVQKFSRHAKLETLNIYLDNKQDCAGQVSGFLSMQC